MSYCVNCGVELDATRASCPLCHTKVYNPNCPVDTVSPTPYPKNVGTSEQVSSLEMLSLLTIILVTASVVCGALNWLVFDRTRWSLYVIGMFVQVWVYLLPVFLRDDLNPFLAIGLDGAVTALFVGMIALLHPGQGWYPEIALPIILMGTVLFEVFFLFTVRMKTSTISKFMIVFAIIAVVCVSVQVAIGFHFNRHIRLTWSAVVLACCFAIDVILLALRHHKGARNELRKRMHF